MKITPDNFQANLESMVEKLENNRRRPEYRFIFKIVDDETGETIIKASTYLGEIDNMGNCESVNIEIGTALRNFEKTLRPHYEKENCQLEN